MKGHSNTEETVQQRGSGMPKAQKEREKTACQRGRLGGVGVRWWEMFTGQGMGVGPLNVGNPITSSFVTVYLGAIQ